MPQTLKQVVIYQINTPTDRNLLPLAAGLLVSCARSNSLLSSNYRFDIETARIAPEKAVIKLDHPAVVGLSCYSWNVRHSLALAQAIKKQYPHCLVVIGGPSAPNNPIDLAALSKHDAGVDVVVHGEGEQAFSQILLTTLGLGTLEDVPGISTKTPTGWVTTPPLAVSLDISLLPSPFLDGTFDTLLEKCSDTFTGTLWETTRGCPFSCTFCYWGQLQSNKIREHTLERLELELAWISRRKFFYVYATDSNFGIIPHDIQVAEAVAKTAQHTGYPGYLMINWTKHSAARVFEISAILREAKVGFNITLDMQSFHPATLDAVQRKNLSIEKYREAIAQANQQGFPVVTDLILGLPCETYESFVDGLSQVLIPYANFHFIIYICRQLMGSRLNSPDYVAQYGIETRECLVEMGRRKNYMVGIEERERLVVKTKTMPISSWRRAHGMGVMSIALYNYRPAFFLMNYLRQALGVEPVHFLEWIMAKAQAHDEVNFWTEAYEIVNIFQDSVLTNGQSVVKSVHTGSLRWEPFEAMLLHILDKKKDFYCALWRATVNFLSIQNIPFDHAVLVEVFVFQMVLIPTWKFQAPLTIEFSHDFESYFHAIGSGQMDVTLINRSTVIRFDWGDFFDGDAVSFAKTCLVGGHTFDIGRTTRIPRTAKGRKCLTAYNYGIQQLGL